MKRKKLILVSLDALSCTDLKYVKTLPHFSRIMEEGAYCTHVHSVYPSLTFPSHASIATGCRPSSHGIVNNYVLDPFAKIQKWNFYASNLKRRAIWDYANESGKRLMSMSWPVSAGAHMAYSMPEMSPVKPKVWNMDSFVRQMKVLCKYGTPGFAVRTLLADRALPKAWFLGKQPHLDLSMMNRFLDALNRYDFDIALLHIYGLDDAKHTDGIYSKKSRYYLRQYDKFVGQLMEYARQRDNEDVTLLFTGDHSQKQVSYAIHGNMVLERLGFCVYEKEKLADYRAYLDSGDGMAYIYIKGGDKEPVIAAIKEAFAANRGVSRVMEKEDFEHLGCAKEADLVLEAKDGYYFESGYEASADEEGIVESHYKGVHGYLPDGKDYQTMMFAWGEDVAPVKMETMGIIDILPSICHWLNMKTDPMDGIARKEMWKEETGGDF
ncbi:MAG: ectonucleotide pyrophosphatase/phosphodiesterase [Lacrimispora sp.]|uniref:alkaline phosphatase family protein n=1 Tax=Lacrimispora sp. TaxID=2719234 RepID=UPI0039E3EDEB